jgi:hypothetical protein
VPPPPVPPPLGPGGGHTRLLLKGWGSPNSKEGTYTVVLYIYKYFVYGRDGCFSLKVVGNEKVGVVGKVAYDRYWSRTVVIDVRFYFYLAAILDLILFPFPLTPAQ